MHFEGRDGAIESKVDADTYVSLTRKRNPFPTSALNERQRHCAITLATLRLKCRESALFEGACKRGALNFREILDEESMTSAGAEGSMVVGGGGRGRKKKKSSRTSSINIRG